jgi:hypothetical protein
MVTKRLARIYLVDDFIMLVPYPVGGPDPESVFAREEGQGVRFLDISGWGAVYGRPSDNDLFGHVEYYATIFILGKRLSTTLK